MDDLHIVWRVRTVSGQGWVKHFVADHPQVTGMEREAYQWADEAEARRCSLRWNQRPGFVTGEVVAGPPTPEYVHGVTQA